MIEHNISNESIIDLFIKDGQLIKKIRRSDGTVYEEALEASIKKEESFTDSFTDFKPHDIKMDAITNVVRRKYPVDLSSYTPEELQSHVERSLKVEGLLIRFCNGEARKLLKDSQLLKLGDKHSMAREILWLLCESAGGDWAHYKHFIR
jgi:hypothetical protein